MLINEQTNEQANQPTNQLTDEMLLGENEKRRKKKNKEDANDGLITKQIATLFSFIIDIPIHHTNTAINIIITVIKALLLMF